MHSLRHYVGKQLVSFLRQGDFAHAGDTDAIDLVMSAFDKNPTCSLLDAGCGLGGTADYLQRNGWGCVSGFDIEPEAIGYARQHYPHLPFYTADVVVCDQYIDHSFDLITLFNAFYAFPDQAAALRALHRLAQDDGHLVLFDYLDPWRDHITPLFRAGDEHTTPFIPIKLTGIEALLNATGWEKTQETDVSQHYLAWYDQLLQRLQESKADVLQQFNQLAFDHSLTTYTRIKAALIDGSLGGVIVYAQKIKTKKKQKNNHRCGSMSTAGSAINPAAIKKKTGATNHGSEAMVSSPR